MADADPKIFVNVPVPEADRQRIEQEERRWTSLRLVVLAAVTLAIAFVILGLMANSTTETYWTDWLIPG